MSGAPATPSPTSSSTDYERAEDALRSGYADLLATLLRVVEVTRPGMLTTVQDLPGRVGLWEVGVPPSGPMDERALERANRLVGNPPGAPGLEATLEGPSLRIPCGGVIAVCGALAELTVGGRAAPTEQAVAVSSNELVEIGWASAGARIYVAVRGGLAVPDVLGSASTFIAGRFGGLEGRPLAAGDRIAIGPVPPTPVPAPEDAPAAPAIHSGRDDPWTLRVHHGPHGAPDVLHPDGLATMLDVVWTVGSHADRTGVRLEGATPRWARADGGDAGLDPSNVTETPYALGAIMVSGETPIIVGPDGPSLGGFAAPLCVAREDRWKIGQLRPGDAVRLRGASGPAVVLERPGSAAVTAAGPEAGIAARAATPTVRYRRAGDEDLVVEYGEPVSDLALRFRVHVLQQALRDAAIAGVRDLTPGMRCLQVRFDASVVDDAELIAALGEIEDALPPAAELEVESREVVMALCWEHPGVVEAMRRYAERVRPDAPWCPDNIEFIRRINGLQSAREVQDAILAASYCVIGLGDVYLGAPVALPLDPRHQLVTTKYTPPRTWTPENAVGIGGSFLCIYGMEGPGGYQLFGRTTQVWNRAAAAGRVTAPGHVEGEPPWLLRHFDRIRFELVTADRLEQLRAAAAAGRQVATIRPGRLRLADRLALEVEHEREIAALRARRAGAFEEERRRWAEG